MEPTIGPASERNSRKKNRKEKKLATAGNHPGRKLGDFRVSQHHNIAVNFHFIAIIGGIKHTAIVILILPLNQAGRLPILDPGRRFAVERALHVWAINRGDHIDPSEAGNGRCRGINNSNKQQRPQDHRR